MIFCRLLIFFKIKLFEKILSGIPSECQTVWTLIRPDDSSGLIWVQTVCQGYQQPTLVDKELMLSIAKPKVFNTSRETLLMLMNDIAIIAKIQQKHCKNEENICTLFYNITFSYAVTLSKICMIWAVVKYHNLACAFHDTW